MASSSYSQDSIYETGRGGRGDIMTVEGAVQKTGLLMVVAMVRVFVLLDYRISTLVPLK